MSHYSLVCYIITSNDKLSGELMKIITLQKVESTNSYAKENITAIADKTAIHALRQTSGRGRLNRSWIDLGDDNLFVSIILKPSTTFNEIYPNLTQYLSVALCKVLETYGLSPQIKWPNDVLINGKKIAGILSETVMQGKVLQGIILGIGVNLNSNIENLKSIPDKIATSLNIETGKNIKSEDFLNELLTEFFTNYDEFLNNGFKSIKEAYINRNCFLDKELSVQIFNNIKTGYAKEVNNNGELILQTEDNKEFVLTIGDIL